MAIPVPLPPYRPGEEKHTIFKGHSINTFNGIPSQQHSQRILSLRIFPQGPSGNDGGGGGWEVDEGEERMSVLKYL